MDSYIGLSLVGIILGVLQYGEGRCSPLASDGSTVITCGRAYFAFIVGLVMPVDCKVPVPPGTTATYTCPAGYRVAQDYNKISCRSNGQWGKSPPTCKIFGSGPPRNDSAGASTTTVATTTGATTAGAPGGGASAPFGYKTVAGIGQVKVYTNAMSYSGSKFACRVDGGDLVYFNTDVQRVSFVKLLMNTPGITSSYFFLGAEDATLTGNFVAVDGSPASPVLWCPGEPVNIASGGCVVYAHNYNDGSGCMKDMSCKAPQSFICLIPSA